MPKAKAHTLAAIAKVSGISRKTVQEVFSQPGAPSRTGALEDLVAYLRKAASGAVELPGDLAEQSILIKFETSKHRRDEKREAAEKLRLWNLEKKGQLVERSEVRAHGAALGILLSSTISGWVKDLPTILNGKGEREMTLILKDKGDALIAQIRDAITKAGKVKGASKDE